MFYSNILFSEMTVAINQKLSYRIGTARRTMLVEILSTAAQLYEKSHLKRLAIRNDLEGHLRSLELPLFDTILDSINLHTKFEAPDFNHLKDIINAWQSLSCSPRGIAVTPPSEELKQTCRVVIAPENSVLIPA